jgi:hypothetical protein
MVNQGSLQIADIKARLGVCVPITSTIYSRALRSMEVQKSVAIKLFMFSERRCLPYSMIRILNRPTGTS